MTTTPDLAAPTDAPETPEAPDVTPESTDTAQGGESALGDAGKQALDRMKADRKAARDEAAKLKAELDSLKAQVDGREAEHKAEQERQKVKDEALSAANERILKAEVRAAAAGKLADPKDALQFIDMSEFEVDSDGNVDADAVAKAIDDLISKKPYLAAQGGKRFEGAADGGTRNGGSKPSQLTKADVERLSKAGDNAAILKAKAEGRLNKLLGIT